jgi:hypothetical protein
MYHRYTWKIIILRLELFPSGAPKNRSRMKGEEERNIHYEHSFASTTFFKNR